MPFNIKTLQNPREETGLNKYSSFAIFSPDSSLTYFRRQGCVNCKINYVLKLYLFQILKTKFN